MNLNIILRGVFSKMSSIFLSFAKAKDIMNKEVQVIDQETSVFDAAKKMGFYSISCIVVIRENTPVGILTERDVINRVVAENQNPKKMKVKDIMTAPLLSRRPNTSLKELLEVMNNYKVRRCPILDQNEIRGIVTETDIVKFSEKYLKFSRVMMLSLFMVVVLFLIVILVIRGAV